jgi:hypothetical protein
MTAMSLSQKILRTLASALLLLGATAAPMLAQAMPGTDVASQTLRGYHFVFIAYTLAWIFVLGWVLSVWRKVSRLSKRIEG